MLDASFVFSDSRNAFPLKIKKYSYYIDYSKVIRIFAAQKRVAFTGYRIK